MLRRSTLEADKLKSSFDTIVNEDKDTIADDFFEPSVVRNPYVLDSINRHRVTIYSAELSLSIQ